MDSTPLPPPPVLYKWWLPDKDAARVRKRRMAAGTNDQVPTGDRKRRHWEFVFQVSDVCDWIDVSHYAFNSGATWHSNWNEIQRDEWHQESLRDHCIVCHEAAVTPRSEGAAEEYSASSRWLHGAREYHAAQDARSR